MVCDGTWEGFNVADTAPALTDRATASAAAEDEGGAADEAAGAVGAVSVMIASPSDSRLSAEVAVSAAFSLSSSESSSVPLEESELSD